ncbi:uncharacterized protein LOC120350425 isoform X1 [Nilaparvata lugens]|uniref:uncharacterized protein LOC120350425 isoform X1 n=2 Tax=Nilaparvata lugens TaxID=108931 RepID=UPI00193E7DF0|nr:uncharacterized protein LOC120350425 isoform X1 [Nilaparvata lugens]
MEETSRSKRRYSTKGRKLLHSAKPLKRRGTALKQYWALKRTKLQNVQAQTEANDDSNNPSIIMTTEFVEEEHTESNVIFSTTSHIIAEERNTPQSSQKTITKLSPVYKTLDPVIASTSKSIPLHQTTCISPKTSEPVASTSESISSHPPTSTTPKTSEPVASTSEGISSHLPTSTNPKTSVPVASTRNEIALPQATSTYPIPVTSSSLMLEGRRIVDLHSFIAQIQKIDDHLPFHCSFKDMTVMKECRKGLNSCITLKCKMCNIEKSLWTNASNEKTMDVNTSAVSGTISTGGGHSQLEEVLSCLDIPCMSYNTFRKYHDRVADAWKETAEKSMEMAAEEENNEAIKRGDIDADGVPLLMVVADGCWAKRSYRTNNNSLSGVVRIIYYYC